MDTNGSQVMRVAPLAVGSATWLRDEEANASTVSGADKSLAEAPVCCRAAETVAAARAWRAPGVGAIDDEGRGEGLLDGLRHQAIPTSAGNHPNFHARRASPQGIPECLSMPDARPDQPHSVTSGLFRAWVVGRLLDEDAVAGVAEPWSIGPNRFDTCALKQGEPVRIGLVGEQDGKPHGWFVEAAVVI